MYWRVRVRVADVGRRLGFSRLDRLPVLSRGLLYVAQNTRDLLTAARPRLLCYDLRA